MEEKPLTIQVLAESFGVCRLPADAELPSWAMTGGFSSVTRTGDELSVVCPESALPDGVQGDKGWRCMKIIGPLDFTMVGILAALSGTLAQAGVSIFAISTYDTDYILVKDDNLLRAVASLRTNGYIIRLP